MTWRNVLLNHWLKTIAALKAYRSKAFTLKEIFERIKAAVTIDLYNICFMNKQNKRIVIDYWQFIIYILIPLQQIKKLAKLVELRGGSTVNLPYQIFCSTFSPSSRHNQKLNRLMIFFWFYFWRRWALINREQDHKKSQYIFEKIISFIIGLFQLTFNSGMFPWKN